MQLPELCIRRPVMTTLLMAAFVIFGILAYRALPVSELPRVEFPTISVSATLPGASPETMASAVATPLEGEFATISGLSSMSSVSAQGATSITLQFALERDIDAAAQDVQSAIASAQRRLPADMPAPPSYRKVNPADQPILYIAMYSATLPPWVVNEYAETQLAKQLSTLPGVAQVQIYGAQKYAVRIQADPARLAARGIGLDELQQAVRTGNVNQPLGTLEGAQQSFSLKTNGQLLDAAAYGDLTVAWRNGARVRTADVARVTDSVENTRVGAWLNDESTIILAVQRQPDANTVATVDAVRRVLPSFQERLPAAVTLLLHYDRSQSIRASIADVQFTLVLAGGLVVLVILLFLRNLSATLIPALALPISVIGTFAFMYVLGYSLDNLSLLALTLSVGFVVDDAIVMLENIVRHIEAGETPHAAALAGAREIGFTIVSMTASLMAVFIPVMFMGGIVGRLLHEFAVTICAAIFVSGVVSLTLTPMLCSRYLRPASVHAGGGLFERGFAALRAGYAGSLAWTLAHRRTTLFVFLLTIAGTIAVFRVLPTDFIPSGDSGRIIASVEGPQDISFAAMRERQQQISRIIRDDPAVERVASFAGASGPRATNNTGTLIIVLKPRAGRGTPEQIIARLRPKTNGVPGMRVFLSNPAPIRIGGQITSAQFQYTLQSGDLDELYRWNDILLGKLREVPGLVDVNSNLKLQTPVVTLDIERDKLAPLGLTALQVEDALQSAFGTRQISTIYTASGQTQVILELAPEFQADPGVLSRLHVRGAAGKLVPLDAVVRVGRANQALTINHQGQLPAVTLSFNLAPGTSLGTALESVRRIERDASPPSTLITGLEGTAQAFASSFKGLGVLLLIAVLVVYLVLGILYESFIHPLTILSGLPAASLGALLTLLLFGVDLSLYAFVGVIMLIGIVKKNAIMMIDFALERQRNDGVAPAQAIHEACLVRFRPIMMTTMAALVGTLPIALAIGEGADVRQPLGLAVVGGLVLSQFLTLYITPVVYLALDRYAPNYSGGGTAVDARAGGTVQPRST